MRKLHIDNRVRDQIIAAIGECDDDEVSVAKVISLTGLSSLEVTLVLNRLAWENGGRLQVTEDGGIIYRFDLSRSKKPLHSAVWNVMVKGATAVSQFALHMFRMSFGLLLVLSLALTQLVTSGGLAVFGAMTGVSGNGSSARFNLFVLLKALINSYKPRASRVQAATGIERLLESCFLFVFGQPDPNSNLEEVTLKLVAHKIAFCEGVIGEDELIPFLSHRPGEKRHNAILALVVHFDGIPQCSDGGQVFFQFPSLQGIAEQYSTAPFPGVREAEWQFTGQPITRMLPVAAMVYGNFVLVTWLCYLAQLLPWFSSMPYILSALAAMWFYAGIVALFPPCRAVLNQVRNYSIRSRNNLRLQEVRNLSNPDAKIRLDELASLRKSASHKSHNVIYDTQRDYLEQSDASWNPNSGFAV